MAEVYYTECCGKLIGRHSIDTKDGYEVSGRIPAEGDYYCTRCKRDVTNRGNIKNTERNADVAANGSWDYELIYSSK